MATDSFVTGGGLIGNGVGQALTIGAQHGTSDPGARTRISCPEQHVTPDNLSLLHTIKINHRPTLVAP